MQMNEHQAMEIARFFLANVIALKETDEGQQLFADWKVSDVIDSEKDSELDDLAD